MLRELLHSLRCLKRKLVLAGFMFEMAWMAVCSADTVSTNVVAQESGAEVTLANRRICTFRATLDGYSPEERAAAAQVRLESVLNRAHGMQVTTQAITNGIRVSLGGNPLFILTRADVFSVEGQTLESTAADAATALREALREIHSFSSLPEILTALVKALLGFVFFVPLVWGVRRANSWLLTHSAKLAAEKTKSLRLAGLRTAGLRSFVAVLRTLLNFGSYLFTGFLVVVLVVYELRRFPYSRPWGDFLRSHCVAGLRTLGHEVLNALPELMIVVLIVLFARMLAQGLSRVFAVAESGEFRTTLLDPMIAATTRRILVGLIWITAAVVAYPYIPGSQSLAFKGVTVFAGLLISLGSSNLISQMASGLVLIYSRAYHVGDYVRVNETEGSVVSIGTCVTRIRTIQNEEVHIANSVLLGAATTNYSHLARSGDLFLAVKVTIGYSTPWRQVHAMLLRAASLTPAIVDEPEAFVLQSTLSDFYVEYQLNVPLAVPERRAWVQSDLYQNIQDVFNEYGVQIMSPHYFADPPFPQVVPKSNWFAPPATDSRADDAPVRSKRTSHG